MQVSRNTCHAETRWKKGLGKKKGKKKNKNKNSREQPTHRPPITVTFPLHSVFILFFIIAF